MERVTDTAPLKATALALLCRPETMDRRAVAALDQAAWAEIVAWGREHRFLPHLHHGLRAAGLTEDLPEGVRGTLANAARRSALRALAVQGDMVAVHDALTGAGIDHVFLKGAFLALFAYPQPGLRPLRDIDVLVQRPRALDAFAALEAAGFVRDRHSPGAVEAHLDTAKHLPRLSAPRGGTAVELHVELTEHGRDDRKSDRAEGVIERARPHPVANRPLRFPAPEDLLVHLAVHAVYEHQFDNGPLILPDLHWLLAAQPIDWPRVWADAADDGTTRGVALALALLAREWPAARTALPRELHPESGPAPVDPAQPARTPLEPAPRDQASPDRFPVDPTPLDPAPRDQPSPDRVPVSPPLDHASPDLVPVDPASLSPAPPAGRPVDPAVVAEAAGLLFRSFAARGDVVILEGLATRPTRLGKLLYVLGKAFPAPADLARQFPRAPGSPTILTSYPALWRKLLKERLPELVSTMKDDRRQAEARSMARVSAWLADR